MSVMLTKENQLVSVTVYSLSSDPALSSTSCMTLNNLHNSQFKFLLDFKIKITIIPNSQSCCENSVSY